MQSIVSARYRPRSSKEPSTFGAQIKKRSVRYFRAFRSINLDLNTINATTVDFVPVIANHRVLNLYYNYQ